jgi:hypothetical protein
MALKESVYAPMKEAQQTGPFLLYRGLNELFLILNDIQWNPYLTNL